MATDAPTDHPVVLFDGVCNLCEGFVQFLIRRDPDEVFRFAPLQSEIGRTLLADHGLDPDALESVVLIDGDRAYVKSSAVLRCFRYLGLPYRLLTPFRVLPRTLRDFAYDFVADRRYAWFGKRDSCLMPTPDIEARFLAGSPRPGSEDNVSTDAGTAAGSDGST